MMLIQENSVELFGQALTDPALSHESHGERFYSFQLEVRRLSGTPDVLTILIAEKNASGIRAGAPLGIRGNMRSFNNHGESGNRLIIAVLAREVFGGADEHINQVALNGVICKPPVCRRTPMGREICDLMLAVNRRYGRADYLPCIAWGHNARQCAGLQVGDDLRICGRVQSRAYIKMTGDGEGIEKTAFEISINELEIMLKEAKS